MIFEKLKFRKNFRLPTFWHSSSFVIKVLFSYAKRERFSNVQWKFLLGLFLVGKTFHVKSHLKPTGYNEHLELWEFFWVPDGYKYQTGYKYHTWYSVGDPSCSNVFWMVWIWERERKRGERVVGWGEREGINLGVVQNMFERLAPTDTATWYPLGTQKLLLELSWYWYQQVKTLSTRGEHKSCIFIV